MQIYFVGRSTTGEAEIAPARFAPWYAGYTRAVTWIVAPLMLAQVALVAWLAVDHPSPRVLFAVAMVGLAWIATFALAVPAHDTLQAIGRSWRGS